MLDKIKVPRKIRCSICCHFKLSYLCAVFLMCMIDLVFLFRYVMTIREWYVYAADYPESVRKEVIASTVLNSVIAFIEGVFVCGFKFYSACKLAYALKLA